MEQRQHHHQTSKTLVQINQPTDHDKDDSNDEQSSNEQLSNQEHDHPQTDVTYSLHDSSKQQLVPNNFNANKRNNNNNSSEQQNQEMPMNNPMQTDCVLQNFNSTESRNSQKLNDRSNTLNLQSKKQIEYEVSDLYYVGTSSTIKRSHQNRQIHTNYNDELNKDLQNRQGQVDQQTFDNFDKLEGTQICSARAISYKDIERSEQPIGNVDSSLISNTVFSSPQTLKINEKENDGEELDMTRYAGRDQKLKTLIDQEHTVSDEIPFEKEKLKPIIVASMASSEHNSNQKNYFNNKDFFSFANERIAEDQNKFEINEVNKQNYCQVSVANPYILHRNSPMIRQRESISIIERDKADVLQLEQQQQQDDASNKDISQKRDRIPNQRPSEFQNRIQQIEMQVQQKQAEIDQQRRKAKYGGVKLDYFKPQSATIEQQVDNCPTESRVVDLQTLVNERQNRNSDPFNELNNISLKKMSYSYQSSQINQDFNNSGKKQAYKKQRPHYVTSVDNSIPQNDLLIKQTHSMPTSSQNKDKKYIENVQQRQDYNDKLDASDHKSSVSKQKEQIDLKQTNARDFSGRHVDNQSLNDIGDFMNKSIKSRQHQKNNHSMQVEDNEPNEELQMLAGGHGIDNNFTMIDDLDIVDDQLLTFGGHERQATAQDSSYASKQNAFTGTNDTSNIRQIISNIERNKQLSNLDLSMDVQNQMKQCSTTRRDNYQARDENYMLEQYGITGSNVVIHPQDRKLLQESEQQHNSTYFRASKSGGSLAKSKNQRSLKNLKSNRNQNGSEPQSAQKTEGRNSLVPKKSPKSASSVQKKKTVRSDKKQISKKQVSLYQEYDYKVNVSEFGLSRDGRAEAVQGKKNTGRKWMPSISNVQNNVDQNSSSTSDLPQPEQCAQIAPQPMDVVQPKIQTSDQSLGEMSDQRHFKSPQSSSSNISLIRDQDFIEKRLDQPINKMNQQSSDGSIDQYNCNVAPSLVNQFDVNRTYNNIRVNDNDFQKYDPQPNCPRPSRIESNRLKDIQSEILQHLLKEEDILYKYATESTQEIQRSENCLKNNNQLSNRSNFVIYQKLLIDAKIEKPRFILFARQLQVSFMIARALIRVLPASLMQRFEAKLKALCQNIHQSFLLIIDLILKQFQYDMQRQHGNIMHSDITQSVDFKLLRNITSKKIKSKENFARILTIFRQNNEINILYLKKMIKYILDSYASECLPFKDVALEFQEIIRINYGSANTAAGTQSSNREESKQINHAVLLQKEKEIIELNRNLQAQIDSLTAKPSVIINQNRQAALQRNRCEREPVHKSPKEADEKASSYNSPTPQTYRHLSPVKAKEENFEKKDSEILKRCKSTSKNMIAHQTHLRSTGIQSYGQRQPVLQNRQAQNSSMLSNGVNQRQKLNPVLQQHVYQALNETYDDQNRRLTPGPYQQTNTDMNMSQMSIQQSAYPQQQRMRINDLISASNDGKNMGVLAQRRISSSKKSSAQSNKITPSKMASGSTIGSPQKVNSLMKKYGAANKIMTIPPAAQQQSSIFQMQNESFQGKMKMGMPSQQKPPHQFNQLLGGNSFSGHQQSQNNGSKSHPTTSNSRIMQNRKGGFQQQPLDMSNKGDMNNIQEQPWQFILPESKEFIQRMNESAHAGYQAKQPVDSRVVTQSDKGLPIAQITNVNNNINFFGTVVNHVYQSSDTGRESQVEQEFQGQFYSPNKQQPMSSPQIGSHLQNSNMKSSAQKINGRLTTEKKSNRVIAQSSNNNYEVFDEYTLNDVNSSQRIMLQEPDSSLFKKQSSSPGLQTQDDQLVIDEYDEHEDQHQIDVQDLDNSMEHVKKQQQNRKNSFAQSFVFESNSATIISPDKHQEHSVRKQQRSTDRKQTEPGRYTQSNRKITTIERTVTMQYKMHSTGIGSGIKNLKQVQKSSSQVSTSSFSQQKGIYDKFGSSRLKKDDSQKEVINPKQKASSSAQSQRNLGASRHILTQRSTQAPQPSERNSFDKKKSVDVSATQTKHKKSKYAKKDDAAENNIQQRQKISSIDQDREVQAYHKNLLQIEEQTNQSSEVKELADFITDTKQISENEYELLDPQKTCLSTDNNQGSSVQEADTSALQNTSKVEAEIDQDDEQALIDAEYNRLRKLVKVPYLPPLIQTQLSQIPSQAKCIEDIYTLVLDLDETLIHFEMDDDVDPSVEEPGYYLIRPGAIKFLNELSQYYELVIFTAAMPDYADWILDNVDRNGKISYRLYRQHSTPFEDYAMKDLTKLGRDLSKTMIIDNLAENFNQLTPLNGIWVESWYDDMDDIVLQLLIPFLIDIAKSRIDVRTILTDEIKEQVLYKQLDEGKPLPSVQEILKKYAKKY